MGPGSVITDRICTIGLNWRRSALSSTLIYESIIICLFFYQKHVLSLLCLRSTYSWNSSHDVALAAFEALPYYFPWSVSRAYVSQLFKPTCHCLLSTRDCKELHVLLFRHVSWRCIVNSWLDILPEASNCTAEVLQSTSDRDDDDGAQCLVLSAWRRCAHVI